jgi:MYXO-CTERM domain-containing protein
MLTARLLRPLSAALTLLVLGLAASANAAPGSGPRVRAKVSPAVALADRLGPMTGVARGPSGASDIPVTIRFDHQPTSTDIFALEDLGISAGRRASGSVVGHGRVVAARLPRGKVAELDAVAGIEAVELDGSLIPSPRPLDGTSELIGAQATWREQTDQQISLDGSGMTICDVDNGIDVFHPMFFRADGGAFDWIDVNENGSFDIGTDGVDLGSIRVVVRFENGVVTPFYQDEPLFDSDAAAFDPKLDFLYADEDNSGSRERGPDAGFDDSSPSFGERYLVMDDVNQNGVLDVGEKLIALGTSKIKAFRLDDEVYRRGENLIDSPWDQDFQHGVGSAGVMVSGVPGLTGLTGMAPGADLVMAADTKGGGEYEMTEFCVDEGARVVLHEYAPWMGYHLDGSSDMEALIDETSVEGVVHVNPAGNLSTSQKLYKRLVSSGATTPIAFAVPEIGATFVGLSLLWLDTSVDLSLVLEGPGGISLPVETPAPGSQVALAPGVTMYSFRNDSSRGTARVDIYLVRNQTNGANVPFGAYTLTVADPSPPAGADLQLFAYIQDEVSGWGLGAHFPEHSSEDHLIGYPGTADRGMPIAAFTGHDWDGKTPGERASYSGRGHRIDGEPIMWISGPDNPIVPNHWESRPLSYIVYGGTSGASPHVAGASALILQSDPSLDGDAVKNRLKDGATTDTFTGAVPNDDFGWGKVNVYRSIFGVDAPGGTAPVIEGGALEVRVGESIVELEVSDADEPASALTIDVDRDYDGVFDETLATAELPLSYDEVGDHVLKLRVTDSTGRASQALAFVTVVEAPITQPEPETEGSFYAAGGCASSTGPVDRGLALPSMLVLFAAIRRRRASPRSSGCAR